MVFKMKLSERLNRVLAGLVWWQVSDQTGDQTDTSGGTPTQLLLSLPARCGGTPDPLFSSIALEVSLDQTVWSWSGLWSGLSTRRSGRSGPSEYMLPTRRCTRTRTRVRARCCPTQRVVPERPDRQTEVVMLPGSCG